MDQEIETIKKIARRIRRKYPKGDNEGYCYAASEKILPLLKAHFDCEMVHGWFDGKDHTWIEVCTSGGVIIVDITVDQFGNYPAVLVDSPDNWPEYEENLADEPMSYEEYMASGPPLLSDKTSV